MNSRQWVAGLLGIAAMIAVAACGGGGSQSGGTAGPGKENASFTFQFGPASATGGRMSPRL